MAEPKKYQSEIRDVRFGENVCIVEPTNIYDCEIGNDVFVGPFTEIQSNVKIGARSKIQSHASVCSLVHIGADCFVGHGVMFVNDSFQSGGPAGGDESQWGKTRVGDRVSIGSNATIMPVSICSDVVIGAGAVGTKNIDKPGIYAGNPARLLRALKTKSIDGK